MNAPSVARAVNSTTFTAPISIDVPITPHAVMRNELVAAEPVPPLAFTRSLRLLLISVHTPIASSARYSTDVATTTTMNSTTETANENFITDHGSIRLRFRRARRGPRAAAEDMVERAERTASVTRAAPTAAAPEGRLPASLGAVGRPGAPLGRDGAVPGLPVGTAPVERPGAAPGGAPLPLVRIGTVAEPLATPGPPACFESGEGELSLSADGSPGGGAMPGARVNFGGDGASAGATARPVTSRPAGAAPWVFGSSSTGAVEEPPDFACVSVIY